MRSLLLAAASLLATSCGVSSADDDESCREAANRPFLEACCPEDPDACEPGLVCVAGADGSGPACRKEDGASCEVRPLHGQLECASGECREWKGRCRSSPGTACTLAIGCAAAGGVRYGCVDGVCRPRGNAATGAPCASGADCDSARCEGGVCAVPCSTGSPETAACADGEYASGCYECAAALLEAVPDAPDVCWSDTEDCWSAQHRCMAPACPWDFCEWWGRVEEVFADGLPEVCTLPSPPY